MIKIEHKQIIKELQDKILMKKLKYKNTIIIGDNSTGKSTLLKTISNNLDNSLFVNCPFDKKILCNINKTINTLLIDNIETILEYKDILCINDFLESSFQNKNIIATTHNLELVARLQDFNIIYMHKDLYSIYDGNDFNTFNDVKSLVDCEKSNIDIILIHLLGLKLSNLWTDVEEDRLYQLQKELLSDTQKLILNQIIQ